MTVKKEGLRRRFHFWCCDRFHVASYEDVVLLSERLDLFIRLMDKGWKEQNDFNHLAGERLGLGVKSDSCRDGENKDRGMIQ